MILVKGAYCMKQTAVHCINPWCIYDNKLTLSNIWLLADEEFERIQN